MTSPTIGVAVNVQDSTHGVTDASVPNLTSLITCGVAPTVGSMPFNGYCRRAAVPLSFPFPFPFPLPFALP